MDSVIVKPFDPVKLYAAIEQVMSKGHRGDPSLQTAEETLESR